MNPHSTPTSNPRFQILRSMSPQSNHPVQPRNPTVPSSAHRTQFVPRRDYASLESQLNHMEQQMAQLLANLSAQGNHNESPSSIPYRNQVAAQHPPE